VLETLKYGNEQIRSLIPIAEVVGSQELNNMSTITEKVRKAELEASNSRWPMGTTEPRQGISVACTCINLDLF
jgi:hypothetical protein